MPLRKKPREKSGYAKGAHVCLTTTRQEAAVALIPWSVEHEEHHFHCFLFGDWWNGQAII